MNTHVNFFTNNNYAYSKQCLIKEEIYWNTHNLHTQTLLTIFNTYPGYDDVKLFMNCKIKKKITFVVQNL